MHALHVDSGRGHVSDRACTQVLTCCGLGEIVKARRNLYRFGLLQRPDKLPNVITGFHCGSHHDGTGQDLIFLYCLNVFARNRLPCLVLVDIEKGSGKLSWLI